MSKPNLTITSAPSYDLEKLCEIKNIKMNENENILKRTSAHKVINFYIYNLKFWSMLLYCHWNVEST